MKPSKETIPLIIRSLKLDFEPEYKFHPTRRWRFDYAIPELMTAIEYNGIFSNKSRHITAVGHSGDCEKLNQAQILGWRVLQYTPINIGQLYDDLKAIQQQ